MTNSEIIQAAMVANGITEQAHTYSRWKNMGFVVKRGEHAAFRAKIWQKSKNKKAKDGEPKQSEEDLWYMQTACFFIASQVEPIS